MAKEKKKKESVTTGKRKRAVARATIKKGSGRIVMDSKPLKMWGSDALRLWIREPIAIAGDSAKGLDVFVNLKGGGVVGQAEAARVAIARGLVKFLKDKKLKETYLSHDRNLLVYDFRQTEPHKPSRSKQGTRRHKQRSKR